MKLVFYTNYLNHHQVPIADELYHHLGEDYCFVTTSTTSELELKGGEDYSSRPYCLQAFESAGHYEKALRLAREAETCVFGSNSQSFAIERARNNPKGLSFEMGERWLKHGLLNIGSPVFRKWLWNYYHYYRKTNFHKLCCGSFTSSDDERLGAYKGRHYKWGYFTNAENSVVEAIRDDVAAKEKVRFLWCARFLVWKHPELAVKLAARLKTDGCDFEMYMYGDEDLSARRTATYSKKSLETLIEKLGVGDVISLMGTQPNSEIVNAMRGADIFLFTSDHLEGWGAVANESMANGCALVASDAIGSTDYLVKHKETGMVFRSCSLESLYEQVKYLLDYPEDRRRIAKTGQKWMADVWSPAKAASNLLQLIDDLKAGNGTSILQGPCSKA